MRKIEYWYFDLMFAFTFINSLLCLGRYFTETLLLIPSFSNKNWHFVENSRTSMLNLFLEKVLKIPYQPYFCELCYEIFQILRISLGMIFAIDFPKGNPS